MASENLLSILSRDLGAFKNTGITWVESGGAQDIEMALLVNEGDTHRCSFLDVLHSVLIHGRTDLQSAEAHKEVFSDLRHWFAEIPPNDPLIWWLKMAVERYPMRLVVACDWRDEDTSAHPSEDRFWFEMPDDSKVINVEGRTDRGYSWSTPDPRPWRGPYWRRFFGKRICWLRPHELTSIIEGLLNGNSFESFAVYFPGFSADSLIRPLEILPLWLRLRWVEHLARRVRGLDCSYTSHRKIWPPYRSVRIALGLRAEENSMSHRPGTVPPFALDGEAQPPHLTSGLIGRLSAKPEAEINSLPRLSHLSLVKSSEEVLCAQVCWDSQSWPTAYCIMQMHEEVCIHQGKRWGFPRLNDYLEEGQLGESPGVLFGGALSGALTSHNTLSDLSLDSRSKRSAWRFLDVAEHSLLRVAVCDERVQTWWDRDERTATNAIQRRLFSAFWDKPGTCKQSKKPAHGYYGILQKVDEHWGLELHEKREASSFFSTLFADDPWPAAADALVIHQGILDKWKKPTHVSRELVSLKDDIPWVVVTSGRGKPDRLSQGVRFLPTSGMQICLVGDRFDKLLLVRQLVACGGEA